MKNIKAHNFPARIYSEMYSIYTFYEGLTIPIIDGHYVIY